MFCVVVCVVVLLSLPKGEEEEANEREGKGEKEVDEEEMKMRREGKERERESKERRKVCKEVDWDGAVPVTHLNQEEDGRSNLSAPAMCTCGEGIKEKSTQQRPK